MNKPAGENYAMNEIGTRAPLSSSCCSESSANMTYESARSITEPFLALLGASATVVGA